MLFLSLLLFLATLARAAPSPSLATRNTTPRSLPPGNHQKTYLLQQFLHRLDTLNPQRMALPNKYREASLHRRRTLLDDSMSLPNNSSLPDTTTRSNDFQASHQQGTNTTYEDAIHYTVQYILTSRSELSRSWLSYVDRPNSFSDIYSKFPPTNLFWKPNTSTTKPFPSRTKPSTPPQAISSNPTCGQADGSAATAVLSVIALLVVCLRIVQGIWAVRGYDGSLVCEEVGSDEGGELWCEGECGCVLWVWR
jgi:hypothetical protein